MNTTQTPSIETNLAGPSLDDGDPRMASLDDVYLDGTLVLIGCGSSKRDPSDEADLSLASVPPGEPVIKHGSETGPAWRAEDLYTSSYFAVKKDLAKVISKWADNRNVPGWGVLSAEHGVLMPYEDVAPYNTTADDLGTDELNPDHRVENQFVQRRPDGREVVTEADQWAAKVARDLDRWIAGHRDGVGPTAPNRVDTLLVLAGQGYLDILRDRGTFTYGTAKMTQSDTAPLREVDVQYFFEQIPAGGIGDQMGIMSDAIDRLEPLVPENPDDRRAELGEWSHDGRVCTRCGLPPQKTELNDYDGDVYCDSCHPDRCAVCNEWTHDNGLGGYPLCSDCQTDKGAQKSDDSKSPRKRNQATLYRFEQSR